MQIKESTTKSIKRKSTKRLRMQDKIQIVPAVYGSSEMKSKMDQTLYVLVVIAHTEKQE